jgi:hypothetical protein
VFFVATYCLVPLSHKAKFCGVPSRAIVNVGCAMGKRKLRKTALERRKPVCAFKTYERQTRRHISSYSISKKAEHYYPRCWIETKIYEKTPFNLLVSWPRPLRSCLEHCAGESKKKSKSQMEHKYSNPPLTHLTCKNKKTALIFAVYCPLRS